MFHPHPVPDVKPELDAQGCPIFAEYSKNYHGPVSEGKLALPYQRPPEHCRTFVVEEVEALIKEMNYFVKDKDLARYVFYSYFERVHTLMIIDCLKTIFPVRLIQPYDGCRPIYSTQRPLSLLAISTQCGFEIPPRNY